MIAYASLRENELTMLGVNSPEAIFDLIVNDCLENPAMRRGSNHSRQVGSFIVNEFDLEIFSLVFSECLRPCREMLIFSLVSAEHTRPKVARDSACLISSARSAVYFSFKVPELERPIRSFLRILFSSDKLACINVLVMLFCLDLHSFEPQFDMNLPSVKNLTRRSLQCGHNNSSVIPSRKYLNLSTNFTSFSLRNDVL